MGRACKYELFSIYSYVVVSQRANVLRLGDAHNIGEEVILVDDELKPLRSILFYS